MLEQNTIYANPERITPAPESIRQVGDLVARVVLGECRISRVTKVEGLPDYPFYRTDGGCYSYKEGLLSPIEAQKQALMEREKYETIVPHDLEDRITVEYEPRECDGKVLWAQLGIFNGMLYWKEECTYQFLQSFPTLKSLKKAYNEHKQRMLDGRAYREVKEEHPMRRLYKSTTFNGYADAEYVQHNH